MASSSTRTRPLDFVLYSMDTTVKKEEMLSLCEGDSIKSKVALRVFAARAAMRGDQDFLREFIEERHLAVNIITPEKRAMIDDTYTEREQVFLRPTPLAFAILHDQAEVASYLLDRMKREELETKGHNGVTCLMAAVQKGNLQMVRRLLDRGADMRTSSDGGHGHQALCVAIWNGHVAVVGLLLEHAQTLEDGALYQAAEAALRVSKDAFDLSRHSERPTPSDRIFARETRPGDVLPTVEGPSSNIVPPPICSIHWQSVDPRVVPCPRCASELGNP